MITLVRPSRGHVTQWFAATQVDGNPHAGQDFAYSNSKGEIFPEVYAAADGVVLFAGDARGLSWPNIMYLNPDFNRNDNLDESAGNYTIIAHYDTNGWQIALTGYGHQEDIWVKAGDTVKAGQRIGTVGETGFSAGKHLHFDLVLFPFDVDDAPYYGRVDPNPYFTGSLNYAGTITPIEEDDMPYTPEQLKQFAHEGALRALGENVDNMTGGKSSVLGMVGAFDKSRLDTISQTAEATARLILNTAIARGGGAVGGESSLAGVVAYFDQNRADILNAVGKPSENVPGLDPDQVNAAIKSGLDAALAGTQATIKFGSD